MIRFHVGGLRARSIEPVADWTKLAQWLESFPARQEAFGPAPTLGPIDLTSNLTSWPVRDQGNSEMCVAYAVAACFELMQALAKRSTVPDRLSAGFLYWASRQQDPDPDEESVDKGRISFGNAVNALRNLGICPVEQCPDALGVGEPPSAACKVAMANRFPNLHGAVRRFPGKPAEGPDAERIMRNIIGIMLFELRNLRPVGLGFPIYPTDGFSTNWNDAGEGDGTIEFPFRPDPTCHIGGHAVCVTGFQPSGAAGTDGGYFLFRNSVGGDYATRHAIPGVTGYGYGRVSIKNIKDHGWGLLPLSSRDSTVEGSEGRSQA